jgi:SAM-dependent methyltransferase
MAQFWDERYRGDDWAYGRSANDFVREEAHRITEGAVLCLAEGEGRNAVFLAELGHSVTAVDFSRQGLDKAALLARERHVLVELVHADLATYDLGEGKYAGIVSTFAHVPPDVRRRVHSLIARALAPGGVLLLEAYTPRQLGYGTGGPKDPAFLMDLATLRLELTGLDFVVAKEIDRDVREGAYHTGMGAVVQVVGVRPRQFAV